MNTVGERIRFVRNQKHLSLEQLAEQAGVSKSFLWEVEQNRSGISGDKLVQVAGVLGASLDFLLVGKTAGSPVRSPTVEIPAELSEVAEELGLSYHQTLSLLEVNRSIVARRSNKPRGPMMQEDWRRLYEGVKGFLEETG